MFIKRLGSGMFQSNCYIVAATGKAAAGEESSGGEAVVIDAGVEPREILQILKAKHLNLKYIILTHAHIDHIIQMNELQDACAAKIVIHEKDAPMLGDEKLNGSVMFGSDKQFRQADILVKDGDTLDIGGNRLTGDDQTRLNNIRLEFIHTPGHTPGSMCIKVTEYLPGTEARAEAAAETGARPKAEAEAGVGIESLFTGDTLFKRGIGRTDLGAGDSRQLAKSLSRLMEMQDELTVYPGHGLETTIGQERKNIGY